MRRTTMRFVAATGVLALAGWGCSNTSSATDENTQKAQTFTVISHHDDKTFVDVDNVPGDFAPGDSYVGTEEITDEAGKHMGTLYAFGSSLTGGAMGLSGVITLPEGKLVIEDAETEAERNDAEGEKTPIPVPVLGGTGKYAGARGYADLVFLKSDTNAAKLTFHLS